VSTPTCHFHLSDQAPPVSAIDSSHYSTLHANPLQPQFAPCNLLQAFDNQARSLSACDISPGLGLGSAYEGMFASEMAKEQLQADAQQRKFERRVSLGGETEVS